MGLDATGTRDLSGIHHYHPGKYFLGTVVYDDLHRILGEEPEHQVTGNTGHPDQSADNDSGRRDIVGSSISDPVDRTGVAGSFTRSSTLILYQKITNTFLYLISILLLQEVLIMGGYNPNPPEDTAPRTAAEADAQNQIGQQNRANVGLSGYGGRSQNELDRTNYETAQRQQQQTKQDEQNRLTYEQQARLNAGFRPGYYDESTLGDTSTQKFRQMNRMLALSGMPTVSDDAFTGYVLESQRKIAVTTPGTRDDQFFTNELGKWNRNAIELSSSYHDVGMTAGAPIPANPFENRGDVALAFEKGGNLRDFTPDRYGFNPNVGAMIGKLPDGQGIQETQWQVAKTNTAANVDFQPAIDYQVSQKGKYGVYGGLAGGIPDKVDVPVPTAEKIAREPFGAGPAISRNVTEQGKDWNPFVVSAAEPIGYISEGWQMPKNELSPGTYIEPARGDVFGIQIPIISPVLAFFQPESIKVVSQSKMPETSTTEYTALPETQGVIRTPLPDKVITTIDPTTGDTITTTIKNNQVDTTTYGGVMANTTVSGGMKTDTVVTPGLSGYDKFNQGVRDLLNLPKPEIGEKAVELASYTMLPLPGAGPFALGNRIVVEGAKKLGTDTTLQESAMKTVNPMSGQYTQFYEQPVLVPLSYAGGAVFGAGAKGLQAVFGAGRTAAAEVVISKGQTARAAVQYGDVVMENAPKVLGAMYVGSIAERSTEGGTNLNPAEVVPRARGIVMQEAVPMGYGFQAPGKVIDTVRTTGTAYRTSLEAGETTGKFDYFVKQPVSKPYELVKQDYASFVQEGTVSKTPITLDVGDRKPVKIFDIKTGKVAEVRQPATEGGLSYASDNIRQSGPADNMGFNPIVKKPGKFDYVVDRLGFNKAPSPEPVRPTLSPENEFATGSAYGQSPTLKTKFNSVTNQGNQVEPYRKFFTEKTSNTLSEKAYGKRDIIFDTTTGKPLRESNIFDKFGRITNRGTQAEPQRMPMKEGGYDISGKLLPEESTTLGRKAYPGSSEPLGIRIKSYFQENQPLNTFKNNLFYPKGEIAKINQVSEFDRLYTPVKYGEAPAPAGVVPKTPSAPDAGRVTGTRVVGGRTVPALAKEPSLKSQGISGTATESVQPKMGQRTDFRNQRGAMKPMDSSQTKQGAIQMEMPAQMMPAPEQVSQPPSFGFNILQVQPQEQGRRSAVEVTPVFMTSQITGLSQKQGQEIMQSSKSVRESAKEQQFDNIMRQMQREGQGVSQRNRQGSSVTSGIRSEQTIDQSTKQTPDMIRTTAQKTDQRITTDYRPWQDQWTERTPPPPVPIIPVLPILPGGAGDYGRKRKGRKFTEYFSMGILAGVQAGYGLKTPRLARPKKGRVVPKEMLSPVKRRKKK